MLSIAIRIGFCVVVSCSLNAALAQEGNVDLPRFPSISPDGSQIVFSWRGDLWKVPAEGGAALRLTSHPTDDLNSAWSRDGNRIAFVSLRSGSADVHIMNADGTGLTQVTDTDRPLALVGFGMDEQGNEVITVSARPEPEWFPGARPFMISTTGGELVRIHDAYGVFPVVSPDGSKVLFNRGGAQWSRRGYRGPDSRDVWLFERATREFKRLTTWEGNDGRARWIDDRTCVYASDRQDNTVNLYRLRIGQDEREAVRLTRFTDADVEEFDVSTDGRTLVFAKWNRLFTLDLSNDNGQPKELIIRASEDEADKYQLKDIGRSVSEAALSPDGKTMAYISYGEVYVRAVDKNSPTRRLTATPARERDIAWGPDGVKLYYASDETGIEAIYAATVRLTRDEIKKQFETANGPATQPATQEAAQPATEPATEPATQPATQPASDASRWSEAVAFDVETVSTSDFGDREPIPSPDGKHLSFRRGVGNLMLMDLASRNVRPLLEAWSQSLEWRWSPDSRWIAYVTEDENFNSDIWIVRADASAPAINVTRHPNNDYAPRWSADGRILAFLSERVNNEYDVWTVWLDKEIEALTPAELDKYFDDAAAAVKKREPLSTKKPTTQPTTTPATRPTDDPDADGESEKPDDESPRGRRGGRADRAERPPPEQKPTRPPKEALDLDDAWLRLRRITTLPGSESNLELSPAGDRYYFVATIGTTRGLYSLPRETGQDGSGPRAGRGAGANTPGAAAAAEPKRVGGAVNVQHISLKGDRLVVVDQGRGGVVKFDRPDGETEWLDISDRIRLDLAAQSSQKFLEAARILGFMYYDPQMNGLDWPAVTKRYHELAKAARTADEFDHVAAKLLGELNGSHLGINSPDAPNPQTRPYGKLGITTERVENGYQVKSILPRGPADKSLTRLRVGDVIRTVDLEPIGTEETLDAKLAGQIDREIVLGIERTLADGSTRALTALISPISYSRIADLFYDHWRLDMAAKVSEWSGGKIGYIHIQSMGQESLDVFERDLYAAAHGKQGLIIDVRNNGGGWTTDRLLASIMYPRHAYTVARGQNHDNNSGYPQDRLFIQRYDGPANMLCNEKSFSNAEIIAHAFKTLKRGTLVGQQTAGGVISTGGTRLIDGTTVRIPFRGWFLPDGANMEANGAMPDLVVEQTPQDESAGNDAQLKSAVDDLMKRLK